MKTMLRSLLAAALVAAATIAMSVAPADASAPAPVRVGQTFLAAGLDPTRGSNGWALISHGIGEKLWTVDRDGVLRPQLAVSAARADDRTWTVRLAPNRRFSDGTAVTAEVVAAGLTHSMANNPTARATGGTLTFAAVDPLTLRVATERPVPVIQSLFAEWALVVYHLKPDGSAVFTGPYQVMSFVPDQSLVLAPNPNHPGATRLSPATIRKFSDAQSLALAFEAGQLDLAFGLPPEAVPRLLQNANLTIKPFVVAYHYFAIFNTRRPVLADKAVRQAIDMAIDRKAITTAINGGQPATGAFAPYFPFAAKTARPFDVGAAEKLLDDAGWRRPGPGAMRARNGVPLKVTISGYPQRPDLVTMQPVIKAQLARIGIDSDTRVVENVNNVAAAGDFDVLLYAQHTAPSGDPAFFFNSMLRSDAPNGYSGYADRDFDAIIAPFATETDVARRNAIALAAQNKVVADAPMAFLVSPEWYVGLSKRLSGYEPWGSDYHILRDDIVATN
jgi:peptide/nickel transport system substrate-binding protein